MVTQDKIVTGLYLRTLNDRLGVPRGTLARVETVGSYWTGEFLFTVRWLLGSGTKQRAISDRSLNLWESNLSDFEPVTEQQEAAAMMAVEVQSIRRQKDFRLSRVFRPTKVKQTNTPQLSLFPASPDECL